MGEPIDQAGLRERIAEAIEAVQWRRGLGADAETLAAAVLPLVEAAVNEQTGQLRAELAKAQREVRRAQGSENWMSKHLASQDQRVTGLTSETHKLRADRDRLAAEVAQLRTKLTGRTDDYTEARSYQVVGDWGVDSADSAEEARANVRRSLAAYPHCGAYAQWRIERTWDDGAEYVGPWQALYDETLDGTGEAS